MSTGHVSEVKVISSTPGEEGDNNFWSVCLIKPGVISKKSENRSGYLGSLRH